MNYGFLRVASCSPELKVADVQFNSEKIIEKVKEASENEARIIVFPELSVTSYTAGDLFLQKPIQKASLEMLDFIARETSSSQALIAVGSPVPFENGLYNCAVIIFKGKILAVIPKTFIPNYSEFYERRYFSPAQNTTGKTVWISEKFPEVPFGTDILLCDKDNQDLTVAFELCEDLWVPLPPSVNAALKGATVIANLSASNEIIGKAQYRRNLIKMHSAKTVSAYIYADASHDESTQDLVFSGHNIIAENGTILGESELFAKDQTVYADIDLERLMQERRKTVTFEQSSDFYRNSLNFRRISFSLKPVNYSSLDLYRKIEKHPFVPEDSVQRSVRCREVVTLQAEGLAKRLRHINCKSAVIGLSGGLDSTLALLITCKAFDLCKIERSGIKTVTMPCFGTTDRTYNNACLLARQCGTELIEVQIADSVRQHFKDIGQDEKVHDVTYENGQARERTQVLMDIANKSNGIVIGTGDLSELALGWCTYNGDHMSMYGVNSSIPKTLVRYLVSWFADEASENKKNELSEVLKDILDTPVSPELLPPENGKISQKTEDLVGPYELHDFFLYYLLRFGFSPEKILFLAEKSGLPYNRDFMVKWLRTFYRRFFTQQFKRSCLPDGAKVGTVNLSPRGDWRMPSDASCALWLEIIDRIK